MRSPQGVDFWSKGVFQEIIPARKIVATDSFYDANGIILSASSVGLPVDWPSTLLLTVTFEQLIDRTEFTLIHEGLPQAMVDSCRSGWSEMLDKLQEIL